MFTGNTLPLSQFSNQDGLTVIRDCNFSYVGKIPTLLEKRIVPCSEAHHIHSAITTAGICGIITTAELEEQVPESMGLAISDNPIQASLTLHETIAGIPDFQWASFDTEIHPSAFVHPSAVIADKNVQIGANSEVGPNSCIQERSLIGADCNVGENIVVGLDALEIFDGTNPRRILKQSGGVKMERGVTLLSKCTVVRATFGGFTTLGEGTIADVLIHIAHDCQIGKRVTLVACCEISGRCELDDDAYIGPNACIRNGVKIGAGAQVSMGAVVTRDVAPQAIVSGNFAVDHAKWLNFVKGL
ncbi:MAG: hypothetical protein ABJO01_04130 [Parasphingorhabdus sp.]|uniref:DapH/DapD/GlmU-related protein n=1 Tax=Parasphingorhabdus sp. TaxID=2709688 RepID=UPI003297F5DE